MHPLQQRLPDHLRTTPTSHYTSKPTVYYRQTPRQPLEDLNHGSKPTLKRKHRDSRSRGAPQKRSIPRRTCHWWTQPLETRQGSKRHLYRHNRRQTMIYCRSQRIHKGQRPMQQPPSCQMDPSSHRKLRPDRCSAREYSRLHPRACRDNHG